MLVGQLDPRVRVEPPVWRVTLVRAGVPRVYRDSSVDHPNSVRHREKTFQGPILGAVICEAAVRGPDGLPRTDHRRDVAPGDPAPVAVTMPSVIALDRERAPTS